MITAPPSDYRLAVPSGWFRIVLEPRLWEMRAAALVEQRFQGIDKAPHLKRELRDSLIERAASAYASGGTELYLSMMSAGGLPVPASLVVFYVPPPAGGAHPALEEVAKTLTGGEVSITRLPAGPAIRHHYRNRPHPDDPEAMGVTTKVTHVTYQLAVPDAPGHLLMSFSTPMEPLADALTELFDQIARTLKWVA